MQTQLLHVSEEFMASLKEQSTGCSKKNQTNRGVLVPVVTESPYIGTLVLYFHSGRANHLYHSQMLFILLVIDIMI